jgi:hypothetical protein
LYGLVIRSYDYPTNNITYPCCGVGVGTYYQLFINNFKQQLTNGN